MASKKILLIEDDQMISSMYKTKLTKDEFEVVTADNGADGIELAKKEKPDLIFLDVILPQLDGFTVLQELRKVKSLKKVPIVMLTSLGTTEDQEKGKEMGATDYLVKPSMTPQQISEAAKKFLKMK